MSGLKMMPTTQANAPDEFETDLVEVILAAHHGDAVAALREVIADASFLHEQLRTASSFLSYGAARGWRPKFNRA
jgi:hypothetical protein